MNRIIRISEAHMVHSAGVDIDHASLPQEETATALDPMHLRIVEALLFAAAEPVEQQAVAKVLPAETDVAALLAELQRQYETRGVNLVRVAGKWQFRTANDLAFLLRKQAVEERKLSRAAIETLAIIAYHQPVTRAEIEDIRGVMVSKGTVDSLMEAGWVRPKGRRAGPGRPLLWVTTPGFLVHFGLDSLNELPGVDELRAAGLLDLTPLTLPESATTPDGD